MRRVEVRAGTGFKVKSGDVFSKDEEWTRRPDYEVWTCLDGCRGVFLDGNAQLHAKRTGHRVGFSKRI